MTCAAAPARAAVPRWVLATSGLAPVLLIGGWLVADALQPSSYDPIRQTVSVLAGHGGRDRWVMTAALLAIGLCHVATAYGLRVLRRPARVSLAIAGVAGLGVALSPEPSHGSNLRHLAFTALGAVIIAAWPLLAADRGRTRPIVLSVAGAAVATTVSLGLFAWMVVETQHGGCLGLAERLASGSQACWPFIVALAAYRSQRQCRDPFPVSRRAGRVPRAPETLMCPRSSGLDC